MERSVTSLRNIGPRCAAWLAEVGIHTADELCEVGGAVAYRELVVRGVVTPHRMLLYALGGAVAGLDCLRLTREQKRLLEDEAAVDHARRPC